MLEGNDAGNAGTPEILAAIAAVSHHHRKHHHWWHSALTQAGKAARASAHFVKQHRKLLLNVALIVGMSMIGGEAIALVWEARAAMAEERAGVVLIRIAERVRAGRGGAYNWTALGLVYVGLHGSWAHRHIPGYAQ